MPRWLPNNCREICVSREACECQWSQVERRTSVQASAKAPETNAEPRVLSTSTSRMRRPPYRRSKIPPSTARSNRFPSRCGKLTWMNAACDSSLRNAVLYDYHWLWSRVVTHFQTQGSTIMSLMHACLVEHVGKCHSNGRTFSLDSHYQAHQMVLQKGESFSCLFLWMSAHLQPGMITHRL